MGKIDLSYLENVTGGDKGVIIEMIELILSETPKHIAKIKETHRQEKWAELGSEAHKVKPMFLYVGLTELNETAQELEAIGKKGQNVDLIPALISKIEDGFNEVSHVLEDTKAELS